MQGNIDLLDETNLNEEQKLYLSYAMTSSEQMKQYIKTLIDISRASAGYQLQLEDINFLDFWKHILLQTEIVCKDKGLVIQQTQRNFPQSIIGDRMLLERAFMNLVSNSLEYSPENSTLYIDCLLYTSGISVLKEIRENSSIPVLVLTAIENEHTQVSCFDAEVDDYITKPFSMILLEKRVKALLRRSGKNCDVKQLQINDIVVDFAGYTAKKKRCV